MSEVKKKKESKENQEHKKNREILRYHPPVLDLLLSAIAKHRLPHAILFWGPVSAQQRDEAVAEVAFHLLGLRRSLDIDLFTTFAMEGKVPDFVVIKRDENKLKEGISVEQIEALGEEMALYPVESENRVFYFSDASLLTLSAQNALLKKLEEPSIGNYFFLSVTKPRLLLRTILSRCLPVYLPILFAESSGEGDHPGNDFDMQKHTLLDIENYLHHFSNRHQAQKIVSDMKLFFETKPEWGISAFSKIRQILASADAPQIPAPKTKTNDEDQPPSLSEEERFLAVAYALVPFFPQVTSRMLTLNLNQQKLSLDAMLYYTLVSEDDVP